MKIILAPDSFKGSLASTKVIEIVKQEAEKVFYNLEVVEVPIADGGEGTVRAIVLANDGEIRKAKVTNPIGKYIDVEYGVINDTAVIEMAACSGLPLLKEEERNPLLTTSYGTGEMIKHILDEGFRKIVIGIGGSATNDGGTGAMVALGASFLDKDGQTIEYLCGETLANIDEIKTDKFDTRIKDCNISVMCDVKNHLTGEQGATYVYGPQKGGDTEMLKTLEKGMKLFEKKINQFFKKDICSIDGAGAAGGLGAALLGFCNAKLISGIDMVLSITNFRDRIKDADLIITGEGRVDYQSAFGKVIDGICNYGKEENVPVIVFAGSVGEGIEAVYDLDVKAILTLPNRPMNLETCLSEAEELLRNTARNAFALIKTGMEMVRRL